MFKKVRNLFGKFQQHNTRVMWMRSFINGVIGVVAALAVGVPLRSYILAFVISSILALPIVLAVMGVVHLLSQGMIDAMSGIVIFSKTMGAIDIAVMYYLGFSLWQIMILSIVEAISFCVTDGLLVYENKITYMELNQMS